MKRIIALLMAVTMVFGLAACGGKTPTAAELVNNGVPDDVKTFDGAISLDFKAEADAGELFGGSASGSTMEISVGMNLNIQASGGLAHFSGPVNMSMFGMNSTEEMNQWTQLDEEGGAHQWSLEDGEWEYSHSDDGEFNFDMKLNADMFSSLTVQTKKYEYVVTGNVNLDAISQDLGIGSMLSGFSGGGSDSVSSEAPEMNVALTYDAKTKQLKSAVLSLADEGGYTQDGVTITTCDIELVVTSINSALELTLPDGAEIDEDWDSWKYNWDTDDYDWDTDDYDWDTDDYDWDTDDYDWESDEWDWEIDDEDVADVVTPPDPGPIDLGDVEWQIGELEKKLDELHDYVYDLPEVPSGSGSEG